MAKIMSLNNHGQQIHVQLEATESEIEQLKGKHNNIIIISGESVQTNTRMSARGTHDATKYFLIPKTLRQNVNFSWPATCQKIDNGDSILFVYKVNKVPNNI